MTTSVFFGLPLIPMSSNPIETVVAVVVAICLQTKTERTRNSESFKKGISYRVAECKLKVSQVKIADAAGALRTFRISLGPPASMN